MSTNNKMAYSTLTWLRDLKYDIDEKDEQYETDAVDLYFLYSRSPQE